MTNERIVKIPFHQGEWVTIKFSDLKKGQSFRLYEADGKIVGHFTAASSPYINENGVWTIEHK